MAPLFMSPNAGGRGGCGVSANEEYSCAHGTQINSGDRTPYLTYDWTASCLKRCLGHWAYGVTPKLTLHGFVGASAGGVTRSVPGIDAMKYEYVPNPLTSAHIYRPRFRENKPKTLVFNDSKQRFGLAFAKSGSINSSIISAPGSMCSRI